MKAEERHRLAENELVRGLKKLKDAPKRPPSVLLLMVGLLAVVMVVYWYWSSTASNRLAKAWVSYYQNKDNADAPAAQKAGPAGQALSLNAADSAYNRAFNQLFLNPQQAIKDFTDAAQLYVELSKQANNHDIQLRALVGAGKSYESAGKIQEAVQFYDQAVTKFGAMNDWKDHPLVKEAREHKEKLAAGENSLAKLYAAWEEKMKQVTSTEPKPPTLPTPGGLTIPMPPEPPK
jgi:tetratricopeptide (TPR) repeat protein